MPINVTTYRCLLISPGDVQAERDAIVKAIESWNAHVGAGLAARVEIVRWESHARPEMGAPAQDVINRQLVDNCDFGIAVFWYRLGSPTKEHPSGSAEEIERLLAKGANVMVYFSTRDVPQSALVDDQFAKLKSLKTEYLGRGLLANYGTIEDLTSKVSLHVTGLVNGLLVKLRAGDMPIPSTGTVTAPKPDIRVKARAAMAGHPPDIRAFLAIEIQNYSPNDFFFQGIRFPLSTGEALAVALDSLTREYVMPRKIASGDSYSVLMDPDEWNLAARTVTNVIVKDKIDRAFAGDPTELSDAIANVATMKKTIHR